MEKTAVAKPGLNVIIIFTLDTRVVSSWLPSNAGRQPDLEYVRLQFLNMDKKCSRLLNGKILAIQKEILSKQ